MTRNSWALCAAVLAVVIVVALAFWIIGSPSHERLVHQDMRTLQALHTLADEIHVSSYALKHTLPASLAEFPTGQAQDPTTHAPFIYHRGSGSQYQLCAIFLTDSLNDYPDEAPFWKHPEGAHCFQLDASLDAPSAPVYSFY